MICCFQLRWQPDALQADGFCSQNKAALIVKPICALQRDAWRRANPRARFVLTYVRHSLGLVTLCLWNARVQRIEKRLGPFGQKEELGESASQIMALVTLDKYVSLRLQCCS